MTTTLRQRASALWHEIPERVRQEAASVVHTFAGAFAFALAVQIHPILASGTLPTSKDALLALGVALTRSATKNAWIAMQVWLSSRWDVRNRS